MDQNGVLLAINSGSSSLKLGVYRQAGSAVPDLLLTGSAEGIGRPEGSLHLRAADGASLVSREHLCESQEDALAALTDALAAHVPEKVVAVGHRVVHGGPHLDAHQEITEDVLRELEAAVHLAPLHIPEALVLIHKTAELFAGVPQFACFDTTFHRTLPDAAKHLPLPVELFDQGVRRYGFHGLSCESVMRRLGPDSPARVVIAHLGNGSSVTAVEQGRSVHTTMGLSPTGGIPMGTRSGDLDPAVPVYLLRSEKLTADQLESLLNHKCGLAGLSGGESDMQTLLQRADEGDRLAALAVEVFCREVRQRIGAFAALLGGLDLVVFTGGIGEHSAAVRDRIMAGLDFLFMPGQKSHVQTLPAEEEQQIALHCCELLEAEAHVPNNARRL